MKILMMQGINIAGFDSMPAAVFKSFQQLMIVNFGMMNIIKNVITFTQFAG